MQVTIRNAEIGDNIRIRPLQEEIARLHYLGRPDLFREDTRYYSKEAFQAKLANPDHFIYIAEDLDGSVVGYAFAWVIRHRGHPAYRDFDTFYIDDICVSERVRRQGVGKMLFARCSEKARELRCYNIELGVWGFNRDAIAFYERCGLRERMRRMEMKISPD